MKEIDKLLQELVGVGGYKKDYHRIIGLQTVKESNSLKKIWTERQKLKKY